MAPHPIGPRRVVRLLLALTMLTLALAGCSSSAGAGSAPGHTKGASDAALSALYRGRYGTPPSTAPKPRPGVKLWVLSCGAQSVGCTAVSQAVVDAGHSLGWTVSVCDGKLDPGVWAGCLRSAVAAKADALVQVAADCAAVRQPLSEARSAGLPVVGALSFDCGADGPSALFSASVQMAEQYPSLQSYAAANGAARADWVAAKTDGRAKVITVTAASSRITKVQNDAFTTRLAKCRGCSVAEHVELTNEDLATGKVRQKIESALLRNPAANALATPADTFFTLGLQPAIMASGRSGDLAVIGGEGDPPNFGFIAGNQGQDATVAVPNGWVGWAAVDTVIRVLAKQRPVDEGIGFQVVDHDHMSAVSHGTYVPPVDYEAAYRTAWGLK
ncbi:substrate-binding domain-containing protein [Streptomyces sp. NBC_00080]|uniref:substrate-binding domain-containing protein n=1 Tax=Streptomyces sp. NBC_00080 TaxID=2975645 RepID=UPI00324593C7